MLGFDFENGLTHQQRRVIDGTQQTLNLHFNILGDSKNISDLFDNYKSILKKGKDFENSLEASKLCYANPKLLEKNLLSLKENKPDSFLIINFRSNDHMFSSVARKTDEGFSLTIVNKAENKNKFQELIFLNAGKYKLLKLLRQPEYGKITTNSLYERFYKVADSFHDLNVHARGQTVGNCFLKEPEEAIKFAASTSSMTTAQLRALRKPKGINKLLSCFNSAQNLVPKWDEATLKTHRMILEQIKLKNPDISVELNILNEVYSKNKTFRKLLQTNTPPPEAFKRAFGKGSEEKRTLSEILKEEAPFLELMTLKLYGKSFSRAIKDIDDIKLRDALFSVIISTKNMEDTEKDKNLSNDEKFHSTLKDSQNIHYQLDRSGANFSFLSYQCNLDAYDKIFSYANRASFQNNPHRSIEMLTEAFKYYPYDYNGYLSRSNLYMQIGRKEDAIKDLQQSLNLNPDFEKAKGKLLKLDKKNGYNLPLR